MPLTLFFEGTWTAHKKKTILELNAAEWFSIWLTQGWHIALHWDRCLFRSVSSSEKRQLWGRVTTTSVPPTAARLIHGPYSQNEARDYGIRISNKSLGQSSTSAFPFLIRTFVRHKYTAKTPNISFWSNEVVSMSYTTKLFPNICRPKSPMLTLYHQVPNSTNL